MGDTKVRASDVLVDGFIAQTFTPQDAYNFLVLSLKTPDFLGYYRLSYIQGVWCITQNAPYLPPPSPGIPIQHPQIPLDFNVTETQGTVVPQRRWFPADPVDFRRHVIDANLMLPVFFMNRNGGIGFWLPDILQGRDRDLHNGDSEAPLGGRTTTHIRINVSPHTPILAAKILIPHRSGLGTTSSDVRYQFGTRLMRGTLSHLPDS